MGVDAARRKATASSRLGGRPFQWNAAPPLSRDRMALLRASVKFRPRAMASPTDFIVVVSRGSASGNFSKAKRGTFTTT